MLCENQKELLWNEFKKIGQGFYEALTKIDLFAAAKKAAATERLEGFVAALAPFEALKQGAKRRLIAALEYVEDNKNVFLNKDVYFKELQYNFFKEFNEKN